MKAKKPVHRSGRRELFVHHFIECKGNATEAARRAGYSNNSIDRQARKLMIDPVVKAEIEKRYKPILEKMAVTEEAVIDEIANLAFTNVLDLIQVDAKDGTVSVDMRQIDRRHAAAIKELTVTKTGEGASLTQTISLKLADKHQPLRTLAQIFKALDGESPYVKNIQQNVFIGALGKQSDADVLQMAQKLLTGKGMADLVPATV